MSRVSAPAERPSTPLGGLGRHPPDALLALIARHRDDPRPDKIDVGVGIYRDASGATPVLSAVKSAERRLVEAQATKAYLGPEGDARFVALLEPVLFGPSVAGSPRLTGVQTPGGTGALRLGAELLARAGPEIRVWMGSPTWPNHAPIFAEAGLRVEDHAFFDAAHSDLDFDGMMDALGHAAPGDVILLHGCCHNPTGTGFSLDQWRALADLLVARGLVPFVDLAYQGLGDGLDEDAAGLRLLLDTVGEALVAYSCDKNFGLYRERVGALWVMGATPAGVPAIRDNLLSLARSLWSMPPDHGAAVVRVILDDPALGADWRIELDGMRQRINALRRVLAAGHPRLAPIGRQRGLFALLPLGIPAVAELRERRGIYMAGAGRINVAGLRDETIAPFIASITPFLPAGIQGARP